MSDTLRNEAAERLRDWLDGTMSDGLEGISERGLLDAALAIERRNIVERIRERIIAAQGQYGWDALAHYFDEPI